MIATISTVTVAERTAKQVQIEVHIIQGQPIVQVVGKADITLRESKDRIRSAILNSGLSFPLKTIVINLAPNELSKSGSMIELAIAMAILKAQYMRPVDIDSYILLGGLSLDGSLQPVRDVLQAAIFILRNDLPKKIIVPQGNAADIIMLPGLEVYTAENLRDVLEGNLQKQKQTEFSVSSEKLNEQIDMKIIKGQEVAKKGVSYAAIGSHHTFLFGAPGTGKTMLSRAMQGILPPLNFNESIEVSEIHAMAELYRGGLITERPFRSPHHTTSDIALVGGGSIPKPGEVSLAHHGVLFLDELFEFSSRSLQALREPLEEASITISRTKGSMKFPANFTLLAATNPCRCGYFLSEVEVCRCQKSSVRQLFRKVLGPFIDRVSLEIEMEHQESRILLSKSLEKSSSWYSEKIFEARKRMLSRNDGKCNGRLQHGQIENYFSKVAGWQTQVENYTLKFKLSHRAMVNSMKLALSIMDFEEKEKLSSYIIDEAFSFRKLYWIKSRIEEMAA